MGDLLALMCVGATVENMALEITTELVKLLRLYHIISTLDTFLEFSLKVSIITLQPAKQDMSYKFAED